LSYRGRNYENYSFILSFVLLVWKLKKQKQLYLPF
jgi:hypothetical protein